MSFLNERVVRIQRAKQFGRARRDAIKDPNAYREVRAVNQRAVMLRHNALHFIELALPTGRSFNQPRTRAHADLDVFRDSGSD